MRHSAIVRLTHWVNVVSFAGLLVSGVAILLVHPRLYWGETGSVETRSLIDLPLPFVFNGQNGWGRSLHFLSAWVSIANGVVYVASGLVTRHFRRNLVPGAARAARTISYGAPQQLAYLSVIFLLLPLTIWTGFAMSPALTSVFPTLVTVLGGRQSARTIHFFVAAALVVFLAGHVAMVALSGFVRQVRAMITGQPVAERSEA
jgi:thiosulfate reductase cytochrome b subunit